ncbi:leucine-rich repeat-containing protein 40 [Lingula anatina]|uniref:Leucine-rich repeat-containing protein 40 n=1 Tax=Lingula anatina TaxID=7574 RepID=A0A1S3H9B6_LINAN|nr:leucine-rich repeat-containing protein 40 [Lingula anatina]|eukprot:XP_013382592.1 leucine-rich repeat-containing protein 40 [Lingula anatina]
MSGAGRRGRAPFNPKAGFQQREQAGAANVMKTLLKQARQSGQLNLSNRALEAVPEEVWRVNIDVPEEAQNITLDNTEDRWWEQVDLTKLILASNRLTSISENIKLLPALSVIDAHDNLISSLPEALGQLTELVKLVLSHNQLTSVPSCVCQLRKLQILHISHNNLMELPNDIGELYYLEDVDFSNNKLTLLPRTIGNLTKVMKFNIANNKLANMPPEIGEMNALRILDATHNEIHSLPDELGYLAHLEQLFLRHNRLTHLPLLERCTALKELHLGNNAIPSLTPAHLECLQAVSFLDVRDNKLTVIPAEITILQDLERLDLCNNDISSLPYEMGNMNKLKAIILDGNPLKSIRRDIVMRGTNELKKYLRSRIATEEAPSKAPQKGVKSQQGGSGVIGGGEGVDAHTVSQLKSLDYSNKQASDVPPDVWELAASSGVNSVNMSKNAFTMWPENLVLLVDTLEDLNLGFNRISALSTDVGLCHKLVSLDLRNNQLTTLPQEMSSLQNLRFITLACNRLKLLPPVLYELVKLESILACDNQINSIDVPGLLRLRELATLDLSNNDIMQIPPELGNCTSLRSLQLGGNPARNPRPAILAKGTVALLEYLRDRIPT